jgi:oxalate decarboxylase
VIPTGALRDWAARPPNRVTDPHLRRLAGPRFHPSATPLGGVKAETFDGGSAKEANVTGFPVSDKLAGVYMTLEPGGLRELHWHANAAEWPM